MKTTAQFGGAGRDYQLTGAILLYADRVLYADRASSDSHMAATVHAVEHVGRGQPIIQPGQPVSVQGLERLMLSLGKSAANGDCFLPENLLTLGLDRMAWWCPAGRRRIWFKTYDADPGDRELRSLNGRFVHHPPLLFAVRGGLNVFALVENKRPQPGTRLYRAPYWNLSSGHMCNGNLKLPPCQPENLAGFEAAFFNSAFSHGRGEALTHHPRGHVGFWQELAKRKSPPNTGWWEKNLIPTSDCVREFIKPAKNSQVPHLNDEDDEP